MQPRYYVPVLFLGLFVLLGLGVFKFVNRDEGTNVVITYGSISEGCIKTPSITKRLAEPIIVEGSEGQVVVKALVFTPCIDTALQAKADFGLIDTWYHLGIDVLSGIYTEDKTKSPEERSLTTTLGIKLVAAKVAHDQITQYDQYKGRISISVGTEPPTSEVALVAKLERE